MKFPEHHKFFPAACAALLVFGEARAASEVGNSSGNWADEAIWSQGLDHYVPGSTGTADAAFIRNRDVIEIVLLRRRMFAQ